MKKITVLGGSGFLGSHLCNTLSEKGYYVKIFDLKKPKKLKRNQKMYKGNITDNKKLSLAIKGSDFVFNFAGLADLDKAKKKPLETIKSNILGTFNALTICKKYNVKRFIQASSIYANAEEGGFYGKSKKAAEDYIEEFYNAVGLDYTILRFGSVYGENADKNNGILKIIRGAIKNKKLVYGGTKRAKRKYIHVKDAVRACLLILKKKYKNQYFTITGNKVVKSKDLMNFFSGFYKIPKNKIKYLKNEGHYDNKPTPFQPRKGKNFYIKNNENFKRSLIELANEKRSH
jgi:UDP-glucose 4-epimerase